MQIFDRLLKCHIDYAFTMQGKERQHAALQKVEDLLNSIDCHGGNVRIVTDKKASGLSYEIAQKVSMSGGKAKHFSKDLKKQRTLQSLGSSGRIYVTVQLLIALNQVLWSLVKTFGLHSIKWSN